MTNFKPSAGSHIDTACAEAVAVAKNTNGAVQFTFNDIEMVVQPRSRVKTVIALWHRRMEKSGEEYRQSAAYKRQQAELARTIAKAQITVDGCIRRLPLVLSHAERTRTDIYLMKWFAQFGEAGDWSGVEYDKAALIQTLESAGYVDNEFVGEHDAIAADSHIKARYIVGQFINAIKQIGYWPGILTHWCQNFEVTQ